VQAFSHIRPIDPYNPGMPGGRPTNRQPSPLGARIAQARQRAGLSQNQLALKLGIGRSALAQWERSAVALKSEQLLALANLLAVSVDFLVGRSEPAKRPSGPVGKARQIFERVSQLPRATQHRILAGVEDALVAYEVRKAG
jgi:transcriptional regulator with XRE-family HTH domain